MATARSSTELRQDSPAAWAALAALSALFFLITAGTFTSLGVVLPDMVKALKWDWTGAGLGFTLLGLATGLASYAPTVVIRRLGVRATLLAGRGGHGGGLPCLYAAQGSALYWLGAEPWRASASPCAPSSPAPSCWPGPSAPAPRRSGSISPSAGSAAWPGPGSISPARPSAGGWRGLLAGAGGGGGGAGRAGGARRQSAGRRGRAPDEGAGEAPAAHGRSTAPPRLERGARRCGRRSSGSWSPPTPPTCSAG